jgi:hypothetical protein
MPAHGVPRSFRRMGGDRLKDRAVLFHDAAAADAHALHHFRLRGQFRADRQFAGHDLLGQTVDGFGAQAFRHPDRTQQPLVLTLRGIGRGRA